MKAAFKNLVKRKLAKVADGNGRAHSEALEKAPTGIEGLDEVTFGGLPKGRATLVCGSAGCGKTLLAMEFLVRGATQFDEPGAFISFEETSEELAANVRSLGFDLDKLTEKKKLLVDHVAIDRSQVLENGEYDLYSLGKDGQPGGSGDDQDITSW